MHRTATSYGPRAKHYLFLGHVWVDRTTAGWRILAKRGAYSYPIALPHEEPLSDGQVRAWLYRNKCVLSTKTPFRKQPIGSRLLGQLFLAHND